MNTNLLILLIASYLNAAFASDQANLTEPTTTQSPPSPSSKSFFLFGAIIKNFRRRWLGYAEPQPLFAGPVYPTYGYYNCPMYGCNPSTTYQRAPFDQPYAYHYPPSVYNSQNQQHHQQSNVVIYQNGYDHGYYGQSPQPVPLPIPQRPPTYPGYNYGSYSPIGINPQYISPSVPPYPGPVARPQPCGAPAFPCSNGK